MVTRASSSRRTPQMMPTMSCEPCCILRQATKRTRFGPTLNFPMDQRFQTRAEFEPDSVAFEPGSSDRLRLVMGGYHLDKATGERHGALEVCIAARRRAMRWC